jgi:hypothetical protein
MIKIQQHVQEIVRSNPMFEAALEMGVANFSRLARKIKPLVERKRMEKVGVGAIVMALRRLKLPNREPEDAILVDSIILHNNLVEFVFTPSKDFLKTYARFCAFVAEKNDDNYISLVNGPMRAALIISAGLKKDVVKYFKGERVVATLEKISAISLRFNQETPKRPGIFYPILRALAWDGVSFTEIASSHAELSLFFEEQYVDRAFSTIKALTVN